MVGVTVMSQFQHKSQWHLMSYSGSHTVIVVETAATDAVAASRMMSSASQHAEIVKALHAKIVSVTEMIQTKMHKTYVEVVNTAR